MAAQLTDTSDMLGVHKVFRDSFGAAASLLGGGIHEDPARSELVGTYYANVLGFLRVHHEGEDELVWPRLLERSPGDRGTVERVAAQHGQILGRIGEAEEAVTAFRAGPSAEGAHRMARSLTDLGAELGAHLDEEEAEILPLASEHLAPEEWGELPGHGLRSFQGDKVWLILGLIRENMTEDQKAHMLANMPPPAVEMWTNVGEASFNAFITELRSRSR